MWFLLFLLSLLNNIYLYKKEQQFIRYFCILLIRPENRPTDDSIHIFKKIRDQFFFGKICRFLSIFYKTKISTQNDKPLLLQFSIRQNPKKKTKSTKTRSRKFSRKKRGLNATHKNNTHEIRWYYCLKCIAKQEISSNCSFRLVVFFFNWIYFRFFRLFALNFSVSSHN